MDGKQVFVLSGRHADKVGVIIGAQGASWLVHLSDTSPGVFVAIPKEHCAVLEDDTDKGAPRTPYDLNDFNDALVVYIALEWTIFSALAPRPLCCQLIRFHRQTLSF